MTSRPVADVLPRSHLRPGAHVMLQNWHDLLFAHWPVPPDELNRLLPHPLTVDTYDGRAWVGVVPFRMAGVRLRGLPPVPLTATFLELNVRTYITLDDVPGVWFFSLDASNRLAVEVARRWYQLPYFNAGMVLKRHADTVYYASHRTDPRGNPALFAGRYWPTSAPFTAEPGSLEDFLTARYALYTANGRGDVWRGDIDHEPWQLQLAEAVFVANDVAQSHSIPLPDVPPLLHYAHHTQITAGAIHQVR